MELGAAVHFKNSTEIRGDLSQAFLGHYISVAEVNFQTGETLIIKSELDSEIVGTVYMWHDLVERYASRRVFPLDKEKLKTLTLDFLKNLSLNGNEKFPFELRCRSDKNDFQWVELNVSRIGENMAIVTTRDIDETRLIRRIVDLFVYQNYDYLLLIDSNRDSYTRYTGTKENTPVPPERGEHYTEDMIRYNQKYLTPEDCERVTANMQLSNIVQQLAVSDTYSFTSSGITVDGQYRRSRVVYLYYDKPAGLILCARTDVTQIYLEEQEKRRQLAVALQTAQHDPMTGIYNQKATGELVTRSLEGQYRDISAFLFIDVDNFKMVNDTLGHQKGDELLCFLADFIRDMAGRSGIAGRLGGDEFLLYLPSVPSVESVKRIALQVCNAFNSYADLALKPDSVSCSVGISLYPHDGTDYKTLLRKADQALYTSKRYGKNRLSLYSHIDGSK